MGNVRRIYVEKKEPYAVKAKELHDELKNYLGIDVAKVREFIRYDVENISDEMCIRDRVREPASLPRISESSEEPESAESADPIRLRLLWKLWALEVNRF